jgi:hypothetical protein
MTVTQTLLNLPPGTRFEILESAGPLRGTLVRATECGAVVDLDGRATVRDFETADHEWIRLKLSGKRRTRITAFCRVKII